MQLTYTVHSAAQENVPAKLQMGEREVSALVPGLTVELVSAEGSAEHGHTFRFVPHDAAAMAEHIALFAVGAIVKATFEGVTP